MLCAHNYVEFQFRDSSMDSQNNSVEPEKQVNPPPLRTGRVTPFAEVSHN